MQKVFFDKLGAVLRLNNITTIDDKYWSSVFSWCVWPFIKNLRDVNRVINTIEFKMSLLRDEICIEDIIAMTTIDVLEPLLYTWIGNNRDFLCGNTRYSYMSNREKNTNKKNEEYKKRLLDVGVINTDRAIYAVAALFPHFANETGLSLSYQSTDNAKKDMRIAEIKRATLLFDMDKDNIEIPRTVIVDSLSNYTQNEYGCFLDQINNEGHILYYLDEIDALIDEIPAGRLTLIIKELWKRSRKFKGTSAVSFLVIPASWKTESIIDKLIKKLPSNQVRFDLFKDVLKNADINEMESMGERINTIELAYGRLAGKGNEHKEGQLIETEQLEKLESEYAKRAKKLAENEDVFLGYSLRYFSYLWESFDKKEFSKFIKVKFKNKRFMLRFICRLAGKWTGTEGKGWSYNKEDYFEYITDEKIYDIINNYDKKQIKQDFDDEELVRIASFFLYHGKNPVREHVAISEAQELVDSWG